MGVVSPGRRSSALHVPLAVDKRSVQPAPPLSAFGAGIVRYVERPVNAAYGVAKGESVVESS